MERKVNADDQDASGRPDGGKVGTREQSAFNDAESEVPDESPEAPRSVSRRLISGIKDDRKAMVGATFVLLFIVVAIFAPVASPHSPEETFTPFEEPLGQSVGDWDDDATTETVIHVLGTDSYGHDMLTRIIYGARVSLIVAFGTVGFAFTIGTSIGLLAGFYGGWIDSVLMRYVDFQWAFPELILAVGLIAVTGGTGLENVVIAIGIAFIDDFARIVRGEVIAISQQEYVTAARAVGMSNRRIMLKEILPNATAPIIVQATVMLPIAILAEAGLSFLGLGVNPTTPTWGILISSGRNYIEMAWWISVMPGLAIMVTVLSMNLLGDGLRDIFDVTDTEMGE